ncbi:MAG: type 2 isopentenyl-diphosphate Delta-isomerase [Acidaminococcaceae bacterium]|nr:type 2 isopentenyl-diphosphate Delta-isomerase [Acidaminococcaceae bacterium]
MTREQRKLDHIRYALELNSGNRGTGLEDVRFLHNCLTPVDPEKVDISTRIGSQKLPVPVFIDAITGGTREVKEINRRLAVIAREAGVAMAVGSQYGAVRDGQHADTYKVVREENPEGIIFANVSALVSPEEAKAAVDMIAADALEIHLNVAQELIMPEGDKTFSRIAGNLSRLQDCVQVPIIIKETGCGMAAEQIRELQAGGFTCFNIAGCGGTSFAAIEAARGKKKRYEKFAEWGIPTAWSLIDAAHGLQPWDTMIASGGIRSGLDAAKAIALGADAVAMSGNILALLLQQGEEAAVSYLQDVIADLKDIMVLTGSRTVRELQQVPLIFTGDTLAFIQSRGYDAQFKRKR